jgi:hypothetical protein
MKIDKSFWLWVPCVSVGPFRFGTSINNYVKQYELYEEDEYYRQTDEKKSIPKLCNLSNEFKNVKEFLTLQYNHSFTIYTKNLLIDDIRIETYLYYNNQDIIGNSLDNVMKIIERSSWDFEDSQEIDDDCIQQIYHFYDLGLTVWTSNEIVVTAFCDDGTAWIKNETNTE